MVEENITARERARKTAQQLTQPQQQLESLSGQIPDPAVDPQAFVAYQRRLAQQAKIPLQQAQQQLRGVRRKRAFTPRSERLARAEQKKQIEKQLGEVGTFEKEFEAQVLRAKPGLARPEALQQKYREVTSDIQAKISNLTTDIGNVEAQKQDLLEVFRAGDISSGDYKSSLSSLKDEIKQLKSEKRGWSQGLAGTPAEVIQRFQTGEVKGLATYFKQKEIRTEFKNL